MNKSEEWARLFGGVWRYDRRSYQWRDENDRYIARVHTGAYDVNGEPLPGWRYMMYDRSGYATDVGLAQLRASASADAQYKP